MANVVGSALGTNNASTTFNIARIAECPDCDKLHPDPRSYETYLHVQARGREVAAGILLAANLRAIYWHRYPQLRLNGVRNVLLDWGCHREPHEILVIDDGDFSLNESQAKLRSAVNNLVRQVCSGSAEECRYAESQFLCQVLVGFKEDMEIMKAMYTEMTAQGSEEVSIAQYMINGLPFYLPCIPVEDEDTDADDGEHVFFRYHMTVLAHLSTHWFNRVRHMLLSPILCEDCTSQQQ